MLRFDKPRIGERHGSAAEIIGVCDRTLRRMRENHQQFGYTCGCIRKYISI
jgi:hypothetical protein